MVETRKDYTTPIVLAGALGAMGLGAYLMFWPKGSKPGGIVTATFEFDYSGNGGIYILQLSLGDIRLFGIFDHIDGMTWRRDMVLSVYDEAGNELEKPIRFKEEFEFQLPGATKPRRYDAEAGIRVPGSEEFDFVENGVLKVEGALMVEELK